MECYKEMQLRLPIFVVDKIEAAAEEVGVDFRTFVDELLSLVIEKEECILLTTLGFLERAQHGRAESACTEQ